MCSPTAIGAEVNLEEVDHREWLLRLNFSPEHILNGEVIPSAVSLSDLKSRGFSIDRETLLDLQVILIRASEQQLKALGSREASYISRFQCGPVCQEVDEKGEPAFIINPDPIPKNNAHAHILSAIPRGDGALRGIRKLLLPHLQKFVALEEYVKHGAVER